MEAHSSLNPDLTSAPIGSSVAHGLSSDAYSSTQFWNREITTLFPASWVFVGFAHQLANPGDVHPVTVAGQPAVLIKNQKGEIKAFHNVCRHRCLKLVEKKGNVGKKLTCPYHAWVYDLDGGLRSTPYFGGTEHNQEGFDRSKNGLMPIRLETWHDWLFINLDHSAQPFEQFIAPLQRNLMGMALSDLRLVGVIDLGEVKTNWKFLMENFIEPYHVQFVHAKTTDQPLLNHYTLADEHCLGSAVEISPDQERSVKKGNTLAVTSRYLTLFPNFVFGLYMPDQVGVHLNIPIAPDRTRQFRAIYTIGENRLSAQQEEDMKSLWRSVHVEDHEICERLQKGRASMAANDGGVLSPYWENGVEKFQSLVIQATAQDTKQ